MLLKDKVAVVTGSGRGIGRAIAHALAEAGARVVVNDYGVKPDGSEPATGPADEAVAEIRRAGGVAVASYDTVATMEGGQQIIQTAVDSFGRVDILVNCAGVTRDRMVFNMTEEEWDSVIAVHLKGHFACTKFASIIMRQQRSGRIINVTSRSGLEGIFPGQANYSAAKAGVAGFTKTVARELGRYGITVNAICPVAATRITASAAVRQAVGGAVARDQEQPPEDVAPIVVYLASGQAAYINGQIFFAVGGQIGLYSEPTVTKSIHKATRWTVDELLDIIPRTLAQGLVGSP